MGNKKKDSSPILKPKTVSEFQQLNRRLNSQGFIAIDFLKQGGVKSISLGGGDKATAEAQDMSVVMGCGAWSNGPLAQVAWSFDERIDTVEKVKDKDGKEMGLGYVKWGPNNATPSVIPPLAQSSPYTSAPLAYIADLTTGLGPCLMYRMPDDTLVDFRDAGKQLLNMGDTNAYQDWQKTWYGHDVNDDLGKLHIPGAKEFLEENNLSFHLSQCEQDDVMLDIYFPTIGFSNKGRRGSWNPVINRVGFLPAHSTRLEKMDSNRFIHHCYFSDQWRTNGAHGVKKTTAVSNPESQKITMYQAAMPQNLLHELRYIVESNQKTAAGRRPMWVVCPTFFPSLNKPYYPQPAWWSVFTSKAFDFSATILYDKYKARENSTSWGKIIYISLDYLNMIFADDGIEGDKDAQQKYIDGLDADVENFLQRRENNGKMMRQFMWTDQKGDDHYNVKIVDVAETVKDAVQAGKDELELSTNPIFLALRVDPRLVGVPMVHSSNGGTAVREMTLLKQQQLNPKQRLYEHFLNSIARFNGWSERAEFHIKQQTFTTLDNSKTGTVETIAGEGS